MINRTLLKEQAKDCLSGNWGIALGAYLLYSVILSAASSFTGGIASIFAGVLAFGLYSIYLSIIRKGGAKIEDLFAGFNHFGNTLVAGLLHTLFLTLWTLLFIIPGIVKSYSYAMTYYILADNPDMDGNEAITKSREMMNGHKGELFLLDLSFIGWHLLALLTCGLLYLYVTPYVEATRAAFYDTLKKASEPASSAEPTDFSEGGGADVNEVTEL